MANELRDKGIEIANDAVAADNAGNYEDAISKYCKAAEYVLTATKYEKNPVPLSFDGRTATKRSASASRERFRDVALAVRIAVGRGELGRLCPLALSVRLVRLCHSPPPGQTKRR